MGKIASRRKGRYPSKPRKIRPPKRHTLNIEEQETSTDKPHIPVGRRIVDINFFFKQILDYGKHFPFDCGIGDMIIINEYQEGLSSKFLLKCNFCNVTKSIFTEDFERNDEMSTNDSAISAMITTGNGYAHLAEICAALNMPCMSAKTYNAHSLVMNNAFEKTASLVMEEAAKEEAALAIADGNVNENGVPMITVVADGAWSKRSYRSNYNALSGVGCIVGQRTKKLLYIGVRNKYCYICSRAQTNDVVDVPPHTCFKNWEGTSTGMETDIIVQGFQSSIEMFGLIYARLVGDGDSSLHKKLLETKPYGNRLVEKVECRNHILRNLCNHLRELSTKRTSSTGQYVSTALRNLLRANVYRLRIAIQRAITYRRNQEGTDKERSDLLKVDIRNSVSHVFGEHAQCENIGYFCKGRKEGEKNWLPDMKKCGLHLDIQSKLNRVAFNSYSLILNMTTNDAELYNSILAKYIGGKRVFLSRKGEYKTRCEVAAISYNKGSELHRLIHKSITDTSPGMHTKKYILQQKKQKLLRRSRPTSSFKPKKLFDVTGNVDYGSNATRPDMSSEDLAVAKDDFLKSLQMSDDERRTLFTNTISQRASFEWRQQRLLRLTASNFGTVCKLRPTTSRANIVKNILYSDFKGSKATQFGLDHEDIAKNYFTEKTGLKILPSGLFIHKTVPFLAATPDGLIADTDAIIEIKCPYTASDFTPEEAINNKKITFSKLINGSTVLNVSHNYYYQVQGQLQIADKTLCYFVIWTPKGMSVEKIKRDDLFWEQKMLPKLKTFYLEYLLPELVDPRFKRNMPIRDNRVLK